MTKDTQELIGYLTQNNIQYKICEYVAGKGSGYEIGKVVKVLYVGTNMNEFIAISDKFQNLNEFSLCRLKSEKDIKKMIEKGFHSLIKL